MSHRHVDSFFEVADEERAGLVQLLTKARQGLEQEFRVRRRRSASTTGRPPAYLP
jgi:diadenosine tetraphosphate (Ap4A) HIT family hydrolase